jgi:hypothetical protein
MYSPFTESLEARAAHPWTSRALVGWGAPLAIVPTAHVHPAERGTPYTPGHDATRLRDSIAAKGVRRPLFVRCDGPEAFTVIHGQRRLEAARALELPELPVQVIADAAMHDEEQCIKFYVRTLLPTLFVPEEIEGFLQHLEAEGGYTRETLRADLRAFVRTGRITVTNRARADLEFALHLLPPGAVAVLAAYTWLERGFVDAYLEHALPEVEFAALVIGRNSRTEILLHALRRATDLLRDDEASSFALDSLADEIEEVPETAEHWVRAQPQVNTPAVHEQLLWTLRIVRERCELYEQLEHNVIRLTALYEN